MELNGSIAVITGAGSGIGQAVAVELAKHSAYGLALVDQNAVDTTVKQINIVSSDTLTWSFCGDTTDANFRRKVFDIMELHCHRRVNIVVPAAGITRDGMMVKVDKTTGKVEMYAESLFKQVLEVNLMAPVYWSMEMLARIAADRFDHKMPKWQPTEEEQGMTVFIGSVSSQGNKGQIAYACTKKALEGAASTYMKESMFHGVRCAVIHPGFTNTPMVGRQAGAGVHRHQNPPLHSDSSFDPAGGDRQGRVLHDL